jgi:hypothetical protein
LPVLLNLEQLLTNLIRIKYRDGQVRFISRNHFTSVDWIPHLLQEDILEDITEQIYPAAVEQRAVLDIAKWYGDKIEKAASKQAREALVDFRQFYPEKVEARLNYIPLKKMLSREVVKQLKRERIVVFNMVKEKKANIPVIVAHQGFIIYDAKKDQLIFRHASTNGQVLDSKYKHYIRARRRDRRWKTLGFNILGIIEQ